MKFYGYQAKLLMKLDAIVNWKMLCVEVKSLHLACFSWAESGF